MRNLARELEAARGLESASPREFAYRWSLRTQKARICVPRGLEFASSECWNLRPQRAEICVPRGLESAFPRGLESAFPRGLESASPEGWNLRPPEGWNLRLQRAEICVPGICVPQFASQRAGICVPRGLEFAFPRGLKSASSEG